MPRRIMYAKEVRDQGPRHRSVNQISGTIPPQIGSLARIQALHIFENHLNGSIPEEIGYLRSLTELALSTNFFNGSIPPSLGNLNNLSHLYLYENHLSGSIPAEIGKLVNLVEAYLQVNQLTGHIPPEIGKMRSIQNLSLYTNIPKTIGDLTELKLLYVDANQLSGPIPSVLGNLKKLNYLILNNNQLSGPVPSVLGNLKNLNDLTLSNSQLTGSIPSSFGNLRNLQTLFLSDNNLIEEIPSSICNLTSLTVLDLSRNILKGKILQCLGNISSLQYVMMSHNNLSGELPSSICNLTSLQILDLGRNNLMGAIPQCFGNMSGHLEVLDMKHNNLSGDNLLNDTFPMWLGTLPELRVLTLRSNKLHGPIRTSGSEHMFLELRIFDLSRNDFSKNLPTSLFQHLKAMRTIDQTSKEPRYLGDSYYHDSVMVSSKGLELELLRILTIYTTIDLSNNKFEGYIPSIMGNHIALRVLNLSHNGLQGCIPQGNQFHTFENNSYEGNDKLRGFPLSKGCGNDSHDSVSEKTYIGSALDEESNSEFQNDFWKAALMGYGTGLCIGLSIIYFLTSTRNMKATLNLQKKK
ncbi:hypothetical protein CQW23_31135 [Capsicum baccatum]|uniref:Uncharacterized protein n=1 Tax=Capsicum baccatum TaxID=33114 RepID=A0A2G2V8F8_CAPBA|nr:hypothetical protein CQW23_31135 [Capsicum baccatum]